MSESTVARTRRPILIWGAIVLAVVVGGVAFIAFRADGTSGAKSGGKRGAKQAEGPVAATVELSPVTSGDLSTWLEATTTLEARNSASLVARKGGLVKALLAEEGQWVTRGAVLARFDDEEARLTVQRREVAKEMAGRELERGQQLQAKGYLSKRELDDLELKMKNAWVELEQARYDLSQTRLVAPFSGRVVSRTINLGETVALGKECFQVADFDPVLARVHFPERELPQVRVGQTAAVSLDAQVGAPHSGRVSIVQPVVDRQNGTFRVTLEIANPKGALRPGAFARVRLRTGEVRGALLVPGRGILSEDGENFVFVARGDSVVRTRVTLGASEGEHTQVLKGLSPGDRIVTVGQGGLRDGAKVKPGRA